MRFFISFLINVSLVLVSDITVSRFSHVYRFEK